MGILIRSRAGYIRTRYDRRGGYQHRESMAGGKSRVKLTSANLV